MRVTLEEFVGADFKAKSERRMVCAKQVKLVSVQEGATGENLEDHCFHYDQW